MAAAEREGGRDPDLYQLLGVPREASGGEITRAWRQRARAAHPDRQPCDAAAPARFRALAEAYRVLGDPVRRAAYDRSLAERTASGGPGAATPERPAATPEGPAGWRQGAGVPVTVRPAGGVPEPPLRAGPVWVQVPPSSLAPPADDAVRLAALEELAARYLAGEWGWPW